MKHALLAAWLVLLCFTSSMAAERIRIATAAKDAKPEQFIDTRFLDNLEKRGLLKELYR